MRHIGNHFSKPGVPRSKEALAALGVEKATRGLDREREGAKGLGEIGLSAAEVSAAREVEGVWDRHRVIAWAESFGADETWVDANFTFKVNGDIQCKRNTLDLSAQEIHELPDRLHAKTIWLDGSTISELPDTLVVQHLSAVRTGIKTIPEHVDIHSITIELENHELWEAAEARNIEIFQN